MSTDSVSIAFEMILEEIDLIVSEVNSQGAAFLRNNEYSRVKDTIASGEKLAAFRVKLESLKDEWFSGFDEHTQRQVKVESSVIAKTIASAPKSQRTVLVVKFADGTVVYESTAAETYAKSIKKFGIQRVIELDLKVNGFSLISKQRSDSYTQTPLDSYLVMTHSSTQTKRDQLLKIASALKEKISVDIVSA
ncbi:MAG: hypothetical protein ABI270_04005 [Nitrosospira sp.]